MAQRTTKSGPDFGCCLDSVSRAFYCPQSHDGDTEPESDSEKTLDPNILQRLEISQETVKSLVPAKRSQIEAPAGQPSSKWLSKWSPGDDQSVIKLRRAGMKWEEISRISGRSAQSCRARYYRLEMQHNERKNELAQLYHQ